MVRQVGGQSTKSSWAATQGKCNPQAPSRQTQPPSQAVTFTEKSWPYFKYGETQSLLQNT